MASPDLTLVCIAALAVVTAAGAMGDPVAEGVFQAVRVGEAAALPREGAVHGGALVIWLVLVQGRQVAETDFPDGSFEGYWHGRASVCEARADRLCCDADGG